MEFNNIVFPSPVCKWTWKDYQGDLIWIPIPEINMHQMKEILVPEQSSQSHQDSIPQSQDLESTYRFDTPGKFQNKMCPTADDL